MSAFRANRITPAIYQDGYITDAQAPSLQALGVTHLLNLDMPYAATRIDFSPTGLRVFELLVLDMAPMPQADARRVVAAMQRAIDLERGVVYVHCNAGLSRSPTAVWLYLVATGWDPGVASDTIGAAATYLSAPDPILVQRVDLDDLTRFVGAPRAELWRDAGNGASTLVSVHDDEASAQAEVDASDAKRKQFEARRGRPFPSPRFTILHVPVR